MAQGKVVSRYHTLINPERSIPDQVTLIHGITNDAVADAPTFANVADEIERQLAGHVFVAHSVGFDYGFIKAEFNRLGRVFERKRVCTVRLSRKLLPGLGSHSLASLCQHFGIKNERAHRALEDAEATASIWQNLEQLADFSAVLAGFLKSNSREMRLPPNLDKLTFEQLPTCIGVYLFHDYSGKVVYVGKAVNIKDRVGQHFSGNTHTKAKTTFLDTVYDVSYETAGSELMALLLENELIKRHYPRFNATNKSFQLNFGMYSYEDQHGYIRLHIGEAGKWARPLAVYRKKNEAIEALLKLSMQHGLCLRMNGLRMEKESMCAYQDRNGRQCLVCSENASPSAYNMYVSNALKALEGHSFLLKTTGRTQDESGLVWVESGRLMGYGYLPADTEVYSMNDVKPYLKGYYDTQDAQTILHLYLPKAKKIGALDANTAVMQLPASRLDFLTPTDL